MAIEPEKTVIPGMNRRLDSQRMNPYEFSFDNLFLCWYAALHARGQASAVPFNNGNSLDIIMSEMVSGRLAIGVDEDNQAIVLGIPSSETAALRRLKLVDGAFLRNIRGGDWVVLRTDDIRTDNPISPKALPVRIWFPVIPGRFEAWDDADPELLNELKLNLVSTQIENGTALVDDVSPWASIPLVWKGAFPWLG